MYIAPCAPTNLWLFSSGVHRFDSIAWHHPLFLFPINFHLVSKTLFSKKKATAYGSSLKRREDRRAEKCLQTENLRPTTAEELNHCRNHLRPPSIYFRRFSFIYCWFISPVLAGNLHGTESVLFGTGFCLKCYVSSGMEWYSHY